MARPLTPEERYNRIINEAWWAQERNLRQLKSIRAVLLEAHGELSGTLLNYGGETLTIEQVSQFRQQIQRTMETFGREYETALKAEMQAAAINAGGAIQEALLTYVGGAPVRLGMDVTSVSQRMYDAATRRVVGGLNLSQRIWQMQTGAANILERDALTQFALGGSAQTMARRIQRYLLPGKELPRGNVPSATFSNQPRDVSYNAYRLARTEINQTWHSVHNKADQDLAGMGVVLGTRWKLSAQHATRMLAATDGRTARDICDDWAERMPGDPILKGQPDASPEREAAMLAKLTEYGIDPRGVYLPGKTPLDHPNGLCYTESVLTPREVLLEKYGFVDREKAQAPASTPTKAAPEAQPTRPITQAEREQIDDIRETRAAWRKAETQGNVAEADAIKGYLDEIERGYREDKQINDALWSRFGKTPDNASMGEWGKLADQFDQEAQKLYRKYTKEGISLEVATRRGAKDAGFANVGGNVVAIKRGQFSVREAQRLQGELWADAKGKLSESMGEYLQRAGYKASDISRANFEQRRKLLAELGQKEVYTTGRGAVSAIDSVPPESRQEVVARVDYDIAATAAVSAQDPLNLPTLDAYGRMSLAQKIRDIYLGVSDADAGWQDASLVEELAEW